MDRFIATTMSFVARLFPNNRRHQPHRPGRHRPDSATRPMVISGIPARVVGHVPSANVMQNGTDM